MSKQNYAVCCYTCEHNGQETCKGCNTLLNGENEPYENWQLREDLCRKDKQIADLQHQLAVKDRALELACIECAFFDYSRTENGKAKQKRFIKQAEKE